MFDGDDDGDDHDDGDEHDHDYGDDDNAKDDHDDANDDKPSRYAGDIAGNADRRQLPHKIGRKLSLGDLNIYNIFMMVIMMTIRSS